MSLWAIITLGQDITFRQLTTDQGLSQFSINSLYEDEHGFIWIGTRDGLNRHNSNSVKTFRLQKSDTTSLFCNTVLRIVGDGQGSIFLLCTEGVAQLDLKTEKFSTMTLGSITSIYFNEHLYLGKGNKILAYNKDSGLFSTYAELADKEAVITAIHIDDRGKMWIGTEASGLFCIGANGQQTNIVPQGNITSIYEDSRGRLWVGSWEHGLICYDKGKITRYRHNAAGGNSIASDFVRSCAEDDQGNIWIGTFLGLNRLNTTTGKIAHYKADEQQGSLSHSSIWSIIKDHQGTLWLGTYFGGVNYFNPLYEIYTRYKAASTPEKGLSSPIVGRMVEDKHGNLWIGTEGGGVNMLDRTTNRFKWYRQSPSSNSISHNNVKTLYYDSGREIMWIGTHLGGMSRLDLRTDRFTRYNHTEGDASTLPSGIVRDIVPYGDQLIVGTQNGVCMFDPRSGRSTQMFIDPQTGVRRVKTVADLYFDHRGTLWIAATGEGLFSYRFDTRDLRNYKHDAEDPNSLSSNNINSITQDYNNSLWISTSGTGLDQFRYDTDDFVNYDAANNGLSSDCVYDVRDSRQGKLLVITNQGFSQFDLTTHRFFNYNRENGFPLTAINENALALTTDGTVFLGGTKGMVSFHENDLNFKFKPYEIVPYRLIVDGTEITAGDQTGILINTLANTPKIRLKSKYSLFSIEFATSNFIAANNSDIVYKLEGFSDNWTPTRGMNTITYTNLNPGTYQLIIKSNDATTQNPPMAKLEIEILPPFYKTTVSYLIYILLITIVLYIISRTYNARIKLQESLKYEQQHILDIEELNQSKLRFYTNISHEFRTPLTLIIGQIEMLLQIQSFTPSIYNKVSAVYKNSLQLRELVNELLDFRKQEQGHMKIKVQPHNIVEFLYENFLLFLEYASTKHINFLFERSAENIEVWYDSKQMQKVVNNLLSNALKHTKRDDTITIAVRLDDNRAIIEISDTGTGIDAAEIDKIFDRFYQTEKLDSLSAQGTGIGLALTKGIIELHGGAIKVRSTLGKGSSFVVTIPLGNSHFNKEQIAPQDEVLQQDSIEEKRENKPQTAFAIDREEMDQSVYKRIKGAKMLIVEDNEPLRDMLVQLFEPMYEVLTACDGAQGVEMTRKHSPQIVLSDVVMPNMSGTELCKIIKNDIDTCHIPVVLLTARTAIEHNIEGLKIGADDYVTKPFNLNLLVSRCNNLVNSRIVLHEKFGKMPSEQAQMLATNPLDKQMLDRALIIIERFIEDPDFNINTFAREMGMARTNLFAKIKAITGKTPNEFISTIRLKRAATMLCNNPELNISDISDRTGFSSPRYFSKCFKDLYNVSPLSYRKGLTEDETDESNDDSDASSDNAGNS